MTATLKRQEAPPREQPAQVPLAGPAEVPPHPHYTLGSISMLGVLLGIAGIAVAVGALFVIANRDAVDGELVDTLVNQRLQSVELPTTTAPPDTDGPAVVVGDQPFSSVIPDLVPKAQLQPAPSSEIHTSYAPDVPPAITRSTQAIVEVNFEIVENVVAIDPATGVEFETWGYRLAGHSANLTGTPGPMIRARVGDLLRFTLTNPPTNLQSHNVDFHAVTGQGGGAADTLVAPGETATIEARLLYPGIFMYHCAAGDVPSHIAHGMYGGILVDPAQPLPAADAEFYIVQSEYYTRGTEPGLVELDRAALTDENPTMVVFNGAKGALTGDNALSIVVGQRARIYFVNAGLNLTSNFHPIGSHWDAVWPEGATLNPPLRGSQTTLVPAGGGVVVDLIGQAPSDIILVDHALTRTFDKGAVAIISVGGSEKPEIFEAMTAGAPEPTDTTLPVEADFVVEMPDGAWEPQDMNHPSEFAETEDPIDYSINVLTIPVGSTVVWTNQDTMAHTVTAVDGSFDSGTLTPNGSWSYTFNAPGEYEYFCEPHPWMRAKVIVTE